MTSHGRLAKVMLALITAMITGVLLLLTLEGKPIRPMAFSLSSQTQLTSAHNALGTLPGIQPRSWQRIEVSYHADNGQLSPEKGPTGPLASQYHFIIGAGINGHDGQIFACPPWTTQQPCPTGSYDPETSQTIRICLIGNPHNPRSTAKQTCQLENLVASLVHHYQIEPKITWKDP